MAVERRLTEIVGAVGGKLHTARSRNDQVATDMAMFTRAHALRAIESLQDLQTVVVRVAEAHLDWAMPGYTHLQRAQPVYLSHHLLAYFWMFRRDARRFEAVLGSTTELPLGAGALAGVNFADRPAAGGVRARVRGGRAELDRRRLQPRLRPGLPGRRGHLRDPSLAAGRGDRALVLGGVRVLRGVATRGRRAPRSCRRRRTPTRPSCCARRRRGSSRHLAALARRDARPPADLQQGHAGGQGAPLRRRRHAGAVAGGGARDARRDVVPARAPGRRGDRRDARRGRRRRHARQARRAVPAVARGRRRAGARGGRVRPHAVAAHPRGARRTTPTCSTTTSTRCYLKDRGWSRRRARAGRRWTGCASSWRTPARRWTRRPRRVVLRAAGAGGRAGPAGLRRLARRVRGRDRGDGGVPLLRARVPRVRRRHAAYGGPARAARDGVRLPLLRDPRAA